MHKERTHIHRCTLSSPSNWATLARRKGKFAHERFSIFKMSSHLFLCGVSFSFFTLPHSSFFFLNIYCIYSTGLLGHTISYSLIGSLCALSSTCSCHRYGFSYPSHHHCCPKTKRKLPKPTSREFGGITFYCITFLFFFLLNLHVSAYIINQMYSLR